VADVVLLVARPGAAAWEADAFDDVPRVAPAVIAIATAGRGLEEQVAALRNELRTTLLASAPGVTLDSADPPEESDPRSWQAFTEVDRIGVLVLLCPSAGVVEQPWFDQVTGPNWSVLPIFPAGANPSTAFTMPALRRLNAAFWKNQPTECVPAILARAGLTTPDHRVFISYRRADTQPLADQLFDALTHEGFDVFVDRFSVPPGVDFQRQLEQHLADKSMVVLLESVGVPQSKWTQHEIDFAKRYRLGLVSLMIPGATPLPSIDDAYRTRLTPSQFAAPPSVTKQTRDGREENVELWGPLKDTELLNVVVRIKAAHDSTLFRRRQYLRDTVNAALVQAGVPAATLDRDGFLTTIGGTSRYAIWLATRPAEVADFEIAHPRTLRAPGAKGVIVCPPTLEMSRQNRVAWLSGLCKLVCIEEHDLTAACARMRTGSL